MLGSSIIDIAIGLIFIYLLLSLICSAGNEIIERWSKKRSKDLERGVQEMLRDPNLVESLYKHPLIYSLFPKPYQAGGSNLPSYIPSRNFALALMDIVAPPDEQGMSGAAGATSAGLAGTGAGALKQVAENMPRLRDALIADKKLPEDVKNALLTFVNAASDDPKKIRENIEGWFDSSMDRVSGWYKRRSQLIVLSIGLVLTILLNVDTLAIVRTLSTDKAMRDSLVAAAQEYAKNNPAPAASPSSGSTSAGAPKENSGNPPAAGGGSPQSKASPSVSPGSGATTSGAAPIPSVTPRTVVATADNPTLPPGPCTGANNTPDCRVQQNLAEIKKLGLPIGWTRVEGDPRSIYISGPGWFLRIIGWLVTALALSLGAPFWFDMLNKFIVVRSTVKPKEKSQDEPSKN